MTDFAERLANADQAEYWNSAPAEKWVTHQADFDQRLRPLGDALISRAAVRRGERVIDVGCGTGSTTMELAELVGPEGAGARRSRCWRSPAAATRSAAWTMCNSCAPMPRAIVSSWQHTIC